MKYHVNCSLLQSACGYNETNVLQKCLLLFDSFGCISKSKRAFVRATIYSSSLVFTVLNYSEDKAPVEKKTLKTLLLVVKGI